MQPQVCWITLSSHFHLQAIPLSQQTLCNPSLCAMHTTRLLGMLALRGPSSLTFILEIRYHFSTCKIGNEGKFSLWQLLGVMLQFANQIIASSCTDTGLLSIVCLQPLGAGG